MLYIDSVISSSSIYYTSGHNAIPPLLISSLVLFHQRDQKILALPLPLRVLKLIEAPDNYQMPILLAEELQELMELITDSWRYTEIFSRLGGYRG